MYILCNIQNCMLFCDDLQDESNSKLKEILDSEAAGDSSDDEKLARRSTEVIKTALYIVTDMERFQPKPKKLNLLSRVYRLLCLRSTTPEDLYSRKVKINKPCFKDWILILILYSVLF